MNQVEVQRLLALAVALDPRLRMNVEESGVRLLAWSGMLANVDAEAAVASLRRFYERDGVYPVTVSHIVQDAKATSTLPTGWWSAGLPEVGAPIPDDVRAVFDSYGAGGSPAWDVACPWCKAQAREACAADGVPFRDRKKVHPSRGEAYTASTGRRVDHLGPAFALQATERARVAALHGDLRPSRDPGGRETPDRPHEGAGDPTAPRPAPSQDQTHPTERTGR